VKSGAKKRTSATAEALKKAMLEANSIGLQHRAER